MTLESDSLHKNESTQNASHKSRTKANEAKRDVSITLSVPPPPPPKSHCHITYKPEKDFWDKFKERAEIAGIGILAVYTLFTILMYCATRKAADAAKSAAVTAYNSLRDSQIAFEVQNRPYVIVDGTAYFLTKNGKFITSLADINYKNVGKTPAEDVYYLRRYTTLRFHGKPVTREMLVSSIDDAFRPIIEDDAKLQQLGLSQVDVSDMAPEAPDILFTGELKGEDILSPKDMLGLRAGDVILLFLGRIHYSGFEKSKFYSTDFCFFFMGSDPKLWHFCPAHNIIK